MVWSFFGLQSVVRGAKNLALAPGAKFRFCFEDVSDRILLGKIRSETLQNKFDPLSNSNETSVYCVASEKKISGPNAKSQKGSTLLQASVVKVR
jgi:hypothetical protein